MRKIIKIVSLSVALLASLVVNASNKINVKITSENSKMLSISLTEVEHGETVNIKDNYGQVLFSERLEASENYSKVFSLSTLPEGLYYIETNNNKEVQVTPFEVDVDSVAIYEKDTKIITAPEITINNEVISILVRNTSKSEVSILVYDESGTLLNEADENLNALIYSSYDTSHLRSDTVTVSITEGEYNFIKEIKL